jgi:glutathione synthase/RimK-type ligase-like ATP-grasp enzyme
MPDTAPIVVVTNRHDAHIDYVQRHLPQKMIVFDPIVGPRWRLSYYFEGQDLSVRYGNSMLKQPRSIWFRKPRRVADQKIPVSETFRDYCELAIDMHIRALSALFPNSLWVSDYFAIQRAEYKPGQLSTAAQLGFRVPKTLFTSDAKAAEEFLARHDTCIVKALAYRYPSASGSKHYISVARKISKSENIDFSKLYLAPYIFQQAIEPELDIRVTVVDNKVFAASITTSGGRYENGIYRDWAMGHLDPEARLSIKPHTLPDDVVSRCLAFTKRYGLIFSAIDLVLDRKGKYWFLENNPNGQWAFIERETGQSIGKTVAETLLRGRG